MKQHLHRALTFLQNDEGATSIEYALLGSLIAVAIVAAVTAFGAKVSSSFSASNSHLPF